MKFKSIAVPVTYKGQTDFPKKIVVPDQSLSLEEILLRFSRNEALPIGQDAGYHESEDDLEKISKMDPVDKAAFVEKQKATQKMYEKQEKKRQKDASDKLRADALKQLQLEQQEKPKQPEKGDNAK